METANGEAKNGGNIGSPTRLEGMETSPALIFWATISPSPTRLEGMETMVLTMMILRVGLVSDPP